MAVAGFSRADLDITVQENLRISGKPAEEDSERRTCCIGALPAAVSNAASGCRPRSVEGATMEDGLLIVHLSRVVPEAHNRTRSRSGNRTSITGPRRPVSLSRSRYERSAHIAKH